MKDIREYLNESLFDKDLIKKNSINDKPSTKQELVEIISKYIELLKPKKNTTIDLNWLDVSKITDLGHIFRVQFKGDIRSTLNFNVSKWNVSNCTNFTGMFAGCKKFNCDLSGWKLNSKVSDMGGMFMGCQEFKGIGLDKWNIPKNCYITSMFKKSGVTEDNLPSWADEWTLK